MYDGKGSEGQFLTITYFGYKTLYEISTVILTILTL